MIQVIQNGSGPWAEYGENGTVITITCHGASLGIDCAARQTDARVTIDVVHGAGGALEEGVQSGESYVATLEIPPAKYTEPEPEMQVTPLSEGEGSGAMMESGPATERLPLTDEEMATVVLRLWTIPVPCLAQEGEE